MNVSLVQVFVFITINFMALGAIATGLPPFPSLRTQMSGTCTWSSVERIPQTQLILVNRTFSQICSNDKGKVCTKIIRVGQVVTKQVTKIKMTEVCCPGYRKSGIKCEPICTVPCDNGLCTQPNFCTCYPQYRKISEYHCAPICDDCHHGICIFPNKCKCFVNYENNANGTCVPVCKKACINSECTLPDTCSCHAGYRLSKMQSNFCTPVCNLPCGKGGVCHEPDVCLCLQNYRLNETNQCEPVCNVCENGVCIDPGVCECNENYQLVRNTRNETRCESTVTTSTEPNYNVTSITESDYEDVPNPILEYFTTPEYPDILLTSSRIILISTTPSQALYVDETAEHQCDTDCVNGECLVGHCLCNEGYYESELIPNHCEPICEFYSAEGCINGTCVAPNTCECYANYMAISNHVCSPVLKTSNLAVVLDQEIVKHETGIKNVPSQLVQYLFGILAVLVLVTLITFITYKWYNRRMSYHLHRTDGVQYIADGDECEL